MVQYPPVTLAAPASERDTHNVDDFAGSKVVEINAV